MIKIRQVIDFLEEKAPLSLQESYDNCGLLIGDPDLIISGVLVCLDVTEKVLDEALEEGCNLIVAHHPLIFGGIKRLNGKNLTERCVVKAIKNDLAVYAIHTNLDNVMAGVNSEFARRLKLKDTRILKPMANSLYTLVTYCPLAHSQKVLEALFEAGAGQVGQYDQCSYRNEGLGTFRAGNSSQPFVGQIGELHTEAELRLELVFPGYRRNEIEKALKRSHPYEEVAFNIYLNQITNPQTGAGMIGNLERPMDAAEFLGFLKTQMDLSSIRYTDFNGRIEKVAICGGSGSFLLKDAIQAGAQVLVTADFKYHQFFDADAHLMIADIGHFESEKYTIDLIGRWLSEFFPTFAVIFTRTITNPVKYYN